MEAVASTKALVAAARLSAIEAARQEATEELDGLLQQIAVLEKEKGDLAASLKERDRSLGDASMAAWDAMLAFEGTLKVWSPKCRLAPLGPKSCRGHFTGSGMWPPLPATPQRPLATTAPTTTRKPPSRHAFIVTHAESVSTWTRKDAS